MEKKTSINVEEETWKEFRMWCLENNRTVGKTLKKIIAKFINAQKLKISEESDIAQKV